jgi:uncharacterized FAD-dependent dehydrogenase
VGYSEIWIYRLLTMNEEATTTYTQKTNNLTYAPWAWGVDYTSEYTTQDDSTNENRSTMNRESNYKYGSGGGGGMTDLEQRVGKLEDKFQQILADTTQIKTTLPFLATREELLKESNIIQNQILKTKEDLQSQIYSLDKKISGLNWQFVLLYIIGALSVLSPHAVAILSHFIK